MPLIDRNLSHLVLIDLQERLLPVIAGGEALLATALRLREAAALLEVPLLLTEQYPQGLGPSIAPLAGAGPVVTKTHFDACAEAAFLAALPAEGTVLVCGAETHICVCQTVLSLLGAGRRVAVVADAVGSRRESDRQAGLARMAAHGAEIVTSEMVMFEWLRDSRHPQFRAVSKLVK